MIATIIGRNIEYILEINITRLHDLSISGMMDFEDDNWENEKKALKKAYEYSIFTDGIYLLDSYGNIVLSHPHRDEGMINMFSIPYVNEAISEKKTIISDVYTQSPTNRKVIFIIVPLRSKDGEFIGAAAGEINPANYMFTRIIKSIPLMASTSVDLLDSHGIIISSSEHKKILTYSDHNKYLGNLIAAKKSSVATCHRCHLEGEEHIPEKSDMLAFAPLSMAPWGVSVKNPQEIVFAPATNLRNIFIVIGLVFITTALLLAIGLSRSTVRPIRMLTRAAQKIADGSLQEPIETSMGGEIGALAQSFDIMKTKLADSLDRIRRYNVELEKRVYQRTVELLKRRKQLASLLDGVMKAQEEERKRIARELHDETSQSLAALGMSLDIAISALKRSQLSPDMLLEQRMKVGSLVEGINRIIQDLRPPVLDDLGFESAIKWLLERHLADKGMNYRIDYCKSLYDSGSPVMDKKTELRLFRIVQEAVTNISKHANANNVVISMACVDSNLKDNISNGDTEPITSQNHSIKYLKVDIIDDGEGFNSEEYFNVAETESLSGYGLMGIIERAEQLDGTVNIFSKPGEGTHITVISPLKA
jgi:signal transduction histidine kinase